MPKETILERLEEAQVFSISEWNGEFEIGEECDNYYSVTVTKEELIQLSNEIMELANG